MVDMSFTIRVCKVKVAFHIVIISKRVEIDILSNYSLLHTNLAATYKRGLLAFDIYNTLNVDECQP